MRCPSAPTLRRVELVFQTLRGGDTTMHLAVTAVQRGYNLSFGYSLSQHGATSSAVDTAEKREEKTDLCLHDQRELMYSLIKTHFG